MKTAIKVDPSQLEENNLEIALTVLRVSLYNLGNQNANVAIELIPNSGDDFERLNVNFPQNPIKYYIEAGKIKSVCYFPKLHPEIPFGMYKATLCIESKDQLPEEAGQGD